MQMSRQLYKCGFMVGKEHLSVSDRRLSATSTPCYSGDSPARSPIWLIHGSIASARRSSLNYENHGD
ncbi:hypothetical protein F0562_018510 [Nyssa sinensis]|uniref:Uncharacterized protein n=1 Tax=Nyssa sinensis TaxID=561372 RepID=A0A5J4ZA07_9ASTE|nr:hypothetical protein F0562_018510 [Nyssa sinensis]